MFESFAKEKQRMLEIAKIIENNEFIDKDVYMNSTIENDVYNLENGDFKIALIAPFSAGKSTFINSLIGQDLLSMEITAETSVITKVKFDKDIKIDIIYRDGLVESIPSEDNTYLTVEQLKEILENKTTVKGENTEDTIKEVIVYYPIEMCKDRVELIDTPGLFARHEKHEAITSNILPSVNAVIFMIDPESVGEEHFTEVIQNYVRNAKSSNLETEGRHIFFVINKIDNFDPEDIEKAKRELKVVLQGILNDPQIFEISAYYAMIGKMYLAQSIELLKIQKDRKIKITDPEDPDFTLSGRQITDENAHIILDESKIRRLEKGLENYLESKNQYLIDNLNNELEAIVDKSIAKKNAELEEIEQMFNTDKIQYEKDMNKLKEEIEILNYKYTRDLLKKLNDKLRGGISGTSIADKLDSKLNEELSDLRRNINKKIEKNWSNKRLGINKDNAEERIASVVNGIDNELEIGAKEIAKNTFNEFKNQISQLILNLEDDLEDIKLEIENVELNNIGKSLSNFGNYNLNGVLSNIEKSIEREFSDIVTGMAKNISSDIEEAEKDNTHKVEKRGFFYNIKKFWTGNKEYNINFDSAGFKKDMDNIVDSIQVNMRSEMEICAINIKEEMQSSIYNVGEELKSEVLKLVNSVSNVKKSMINNVLKTMKDGEAKAKVIMLELNKALQELENLKEEIENYELNLENLEVALDLVEMEN